MWSGKPGSARRIPRINSGAALSERVEERVERVVTDWLGALLAPGKMGFPVDIEDHSARETHSREFPACGDLSGKAGVQSGKSLVDSLLAGAALSNANPSAIGQSFGATIIYVNRGHLAAIALT